MGGALQQAAFRKSDKFCMWICILALSCTDAEKMNGTNFFFCLR